jgi:predicted amidohydrolase
LFPESYAQLAGLKPDIIFVPTTSPYRAEDPPEAKAERDRLYFIDGAKTAGAYVAKCCAVGSLLGGRLQGRSLIAAPWGIIERAPAERESEELILTAELDLSRLRRA